MGADVKYYLLIRLCHTKTHSFFLHFTPIFSCDIWIPFIPSFKMGDVLQILDTSDSSWWQARSHLGQVLGVVPSRRRREESEKKVWLMQFRNV